ncbi:hypothetical protein ACFY97_18540 [Streptomyces klenkii]|uniref:hypothetical protein n=1 Tax=Streptomyces klenkii TaxID=1420899 RepID=UPI0036EC5DDA
MNTPNEINIHQLRASIKALVEAMAPEDGKPQSDMEGIFTYGALFAFTAVGRLLKGETAEAVLQAAERDLEAAVGRAYLNGMQSPREESLDS